MANRFADPTYWEEWARDLGWDQSKIQAAGEVGSLAMNRGMTYKEATDVVLARVRDGRAARIGPSIANSVLRNEGLMPMLFGLVAFLAVGVDKFGPPIGYMFPIAFSFILGAQVFLVIRGLTRRGWKWSLIGLAMSIAALLTFLSPHVAYI